MSDLIEFDAVLKLLEEHKDNCYRESHELELYAMDQDDLERSVRYHFAAKKIGEIIQLLCDDALFPRY